MLFGVSVGVNVHRVLFLDIVHAAQVPFLFLVIACHKFAAVDRICTGIAIPTS